jgi:hypothetical protein
MEDFMFSRTNNMFKEIHLSKRVFMGMALASVISAALAWATPGSAFVTTALVRSTAAIRINIKTHPHELNDVQVQRSRPTRWI